MNEIQRAQYFENANSIRLLLYPIFHKKKLNHYDVNYVNTNLNIRRYKKTCMIAVYSLEDAEIYF